MPNFITLDQLCTLARAGEAVCYPTDTVPALAALPERSQVIYDLKQRSRDKPLVLMADCVEQLRPYIQGWEPAWTELSERGWPGALTLVLPASDLVPAEAIAQGDSVGVRVPDLAIARQVLACTGPLFATSVNRSGQPPLLKAADIALSFPTLPILQAEFPSPAPPSTVLKWQAGCWKTLRQGAFVWTNS